MFLPVAGSTQEDLALFEQADAIFQQQQAEIGMMDTQADTQMQRTMSTALDPTQASITPTQALTYGAASTQVEHVPSTFPDTVPVFPMDADDAVPDTVEDYFPPNQEAYFPDTVFTPTQVQHTPVPRVARGRPVVPQARRNPQPSGPDGRGRRRRPNKN